MSPDVESAARFYGGLLDWEYDASGPEYGFYHMARVEGRPAAGIGQMPDGAGMPSAWTVYFASTLSRDGRNIAGIALMPASQADMPAHWLTYFEVAGLDAAVDGCAAGSGTLVQSPLETPYGRMAVASDPFGAVFCLNQSRRSG